MGDRLPSQRAASTGDGALDRVVQDLRKLTAFARQLFDRFLVLEARVGLGIARPVAPDAAYVLPLDALKATHIQIKGAWTVGHSVQLPRATDATAYGRWFRNSTGALITFRTQDGSATLANGAVGYVVVSSVGPEVWK